MRFDTGGLRMTVLFDAGGRGRPRSGRRAFVCWGLALLFETGAARKEPRQFVETIDLFLL
jgi:hypothetical protein